MIAPKINGQFLQETEDKENFRRWYCSFNTTLEITVRASFADSVPGYWGYVEYKGAVIFRTDSIDEQLSSAQDVINSIVKYLHELRNVINYIK